MSALALITADCWSPALQAKINQDSATSISGAEDDPLQ
jgi:hypothetical protein